ncbi:Rho-associated protein kinase [Operophtera brumata]|uniref:Rho-associated protein kinase n=1 Tax=Operophtera brumata TaxID=104452 RepID=A0A0L7LQS6_OPEBR|nr:Rho-associated protein kinase [Operophtera brumata]
MIKRNGDNVFAIASSNQCQGARSAAATVSLCPAGGAATRIPRATTVSASAVKMTPPDAHHNTKEANIALSTYVEKWKNRYEEAERKHKAYLLKSEKAKREYDDLHRRYNILQEERNHLDGELRERERELSKLKNVSEKLFQDAALIQALPAKGVDIDFTDSTDTASDTSSNEEVEFLKQTVSELSRQIAALQTELNEAKLHEFEAHESNVALAQVTSFIAASDTSSKKQTVSELSRQIAALQSELNEAKMHEFEAHESNVALAQVTTLQRSKKQTVSELSRQIAALQTELNEAKLHEFEAHESNVALAQVTTLQRSNEEVEFLKQTVSELSRQIAALQTELNEAKLHEFEAHESNVALAQVTSFIAASDTSSKKQTVSELSRQIAALQTELNEAKLHEFEAHESNVALAQVTTLQRSNEEVEFLKQTVSELSRQIAVLQTELNEAKLHEFEAHESNDVESCQAKCSLQESEVLELRSQLERHHRVSKLLVEEVAALRQHADTDREMCETYKSEARAAKKRVKVLTHQSALLSGDMEPEERLALLLRELDELRAALEDQDQRHRDQIEELQLKLAEKHEDTDILVWEEKIKLAEDDARKAMERAERAERKLTDSERKLNESRDTFLEKKPKEEPPQAVKEMLAILGTLRKRRPPSAARPALDYTDF